MVVVVVCMCKRILVLCGFVVVLSLVLLDVFVLFLCLRLLLLLPPCF